MNDNTKEDTVLKTGSKYIQVPIGYKPPKYTSSDILIIIFTLILFAAFIVIIIYMLFFNKNKGFQPIDLYPNENKNNQASQQNKNLCEIGADEKCETCKEKECGSCNLGYKLEKGKCSPNFLIKAKYQTFNKNDIISLINEKYIPYITELIINNQRIENPSSTHCFQEEGEHTIEISFNKKELTSMKMMFSNINNLISIIFTQEFSNFDIQEFSNFDIINMKGIFYNCQNLKDVNFQSIIPPTVKDFSFMFDGCKSIDKLDLNNLITKNAIDLSYMFSKCISLKSLEIKSFETNKVVDMSGLFYECNSLTSIDISNLGTKMVENMIYMFAGCSSLKEINLDKFEINRVKDISYMFKDCSKLKRIDLNKLNMKNLTKKN